MGSLHAFHSCNFLKMRPKSSRRIPLKRARLISTIGWRSKRAVGRRGRQKTLPFTGLIVSTVSGTSYTTAAWQTGWTARRKHRQMHAGLALQRLAFMRKRKKHTRWNTEQKAFCVRWPPNGECSNRCTPAVHASTHVRTYVCTHHLWVTGSLVAPQPLYLDKLISRFKALSLKNSFHGFLIDARRSSVFCFQHGGKRLNGGAGGWVEGGPQILPAIISAPPGGPGGVPRAGEDFLIPQAWLWLLHEVEVDVPAPPPPARIPRTCLGSSSDAHFWPSVAASRHPKPHLSHHTALFVDSFLWNADFLLSAPLPKTIIQ